MAYKKIKKNRNKRQKKSGKNFTPGIFLSILSVLIFTSYIIQNLFVMQVVESEKYAIAAASGHYKKMVEMPRRGSIFDRNGNILAFSVVVETIGITPADVRSRKYPDMPAEKIARGLSDALNLEYEDVLEKMGMKDRSWVLLKRRIERDESEKLKEFRKKYEIGGIRIDEEDKRVYPNGKTASNILGFVNPEGFGQLGLELFYNSVLTGEPGYTYSETDNYGQATLPFSVPISLRARNGNNLVTTLDIGIQKIIENELNRTVENYNITEGGVAIVMDPYTGGILGMASTPGFDPNNPAAKPQSVSEEDWNSSDIESVEYLQEFIWRNKAISNTYEPGSTFKTLTAAMAMEEGRFYENELLSNAPIKVADWTIQNLLWNYHGLSTSEEAFWRSSNPVFVQLAQRVGVQAFYEYVRGFGFSSVTGIDLPGEAIGIFHSDPKEIDMAVLSFGEQSTVTPLAMINSNCAFANGGYIMRPQVVRSITDSDGNVVREISPETIRQIVSEQTASRVKDLLRGVVLYGTGSSAYIEGYSLGGKTSTSMRDDGMTDISFLGIAPIEQPEIVILVVLFAPEDTDARSALAANATSVMTEKILDHLGVRRQYTSRDIAVLSTKHNVPDIVGLKFEDAKKRLKSAGFGIEDPSGEIKDKDIIKGQWPDSTHILHRGATIAVYDSNEKPANSSVVPDITGRNVSEAISLLSEAGLNILIDGDCLGFVDEQEFEPGKLIERRSTVSVIFKTEDN